MDSFLNAISWVIQFLIVAYFWMVLIIGTILWKRPHLLSPDNPKHPLLCIVYRLTEPFFVCIRKVFPFTTRGTHDLAPLLALVLIVVFAIVLLPFLIAGSATA